MTNMSKHLDRMIFRNSARRTRAINLTKFIPRGGIRL